MTTANNFYNIQKLHRVLMVSPARLGDTIFCTPAFRFLKQIGPHVQIDVFAQSSVAAAVLQHNPTIRKILLESDIQELSSLVAQYDLGINIHDSVKAREIFSHFGDKVVHYRVDLYHNIHQTEKLLRNMSESFGIPFEGFDAHYDLYPQKTDIEKIKKLLQAHKVDLNQDVLIGYHMGCHGLSKPRKRLWHRFFHRKAWPLEYFIKLARQLIDWNPNIRIVLTGTRAEKELGQLFCAAVPNTINLIDQTSVLEMAALMQRVKAFVSNDTGALHVACATHVPVIALFGRKNYIANGPYPMRDNQLVLYRQNISRIKPIEVFNVICPLIKNIDASIFEKHETLD